MYGLKGANQTTKLMTDALLAHYESPNFNSPNKRVVAGGAAVKGRRIMAETGRPKVVRDVKKRVAAPVVGKGVVSKEVEMVTIEHVSPVLHEEAIRMEMVMVEEAEGKLAGQSWIVESVCLRQPDPHALLRPLRCLRLLYLHHHRDLLA